MKVKRIILFFLLLSALIPPAYAADYGEDEEYLGQIVDDYTNNDNVSAAFNVINNETLDCMELNYTIGESGPIYENFTEYTEVDSAADIAKTDKVITWSTMQRDAASWVVYDFGVDYFSDFQCNFTSDFSDIEAGDTSNRHINSLVMLSNSIGTFADNIGGDLLTVLPRQNGAVDDVHRYDLIQYTGGVMDFTVVDVTNYAMPRHYSTLERIGTTITLRVYTDEARTVLVDTLTDTGNNEKYRYFHALASYDSAGDGADHSTGIIANVTFGYGEAGGYSNGYYYTTEILANDTGLVFMYNATIEASTDITAEFSDGNLTWVDHNNQAGSDTLITGFESLDLRDLNTTSLYMRFNMTTDGASTPRIYQIRFVTRTAQPTPSIVGGLFPGLAIGIAILIIAGAYLGTRR